MQFTRLGSTGTTVSRLCLGMMTYGSKAWREWVLEEDEAGPIIKRAIDLGINFFDTADVYSLGVSEEITGRLLKKYGPSRDRLVIATKVFNPMGDDPNLRGLSRKHIMHAIDDSLRRLGTDYVDLYQIHRFDPDTPIEETLEALDDVVKSGKALHIGASSMYAWQFAKMLATSEKLGLSRFVTMQNHYNLLYREEEREMIPLCRSEGIGVIPWSPLARGRLARPREERDATLRAQTDAIGQRLYSDEDNAVIDSVTEVAGKRGVPNAQVALAWLLSRPGVTAPIIGASRIEHLETAAAALELTFDEDEVKRLEEPYRPHPVLGHN
ncbi:aldo/keto reductase [Chelativorans sp. AA-79]|uniref:aldo/keto reductase n=1 Tax=Chelativorans sp. AA-79 TaxID=3028735 RepID=UPI0023F667AA|nr:aldo/keto reductase [Chelativorans sp. AA-79]WEX08875.1 aldo/keto reductase [Chelativorans sp. AA-79]